MEAEGDAVRYAVCTDDEADEETPTEECAVVEEAIIETQDGDLGGRGDEEPEKLNDESELGSYVRTICQLEMDGM